MLRRIGSLIVVAALAGAPAASAQSTDVRADVRCMLVTMLMMTSPKPELQQAGAMAGMYYFGRLDGRGRGFDLEAAMVAEIKAMKPEQLAAEMTRCGGELKDRGQALTEIGKNLSARGEMPELPISD